MSGKKLKDLTFDELVEEEDMLDVVAKEVKKKIGRATVIMMIFDVINFTIALTWIVMISFAWDLQPGAIGTFMMQFLYLPYVLVLHSFFGELRRWLSKLERRLIPNTLVTIQTIVYYVGAAFIITSAMTSVTVLRFTSRVVEADGLYYSAITLSFIIDIMAGIQFIWIVYTLYSFISSWRRLSKHKGFLEADRSLSELVSFDNVLPMWPTKVGSRIDPKNTTSKKIKMTF